jgi:hypothetical protein
VTPLQDIIQYAFDKHGIEYSFALIAAIGHTVKSNPASIGKEYGSLAVTGLQKFKEGE